MNRDIMSRVAPFGLYMAFIALEQLLHFMVNKGFMTISDQVMLCIYPLKVLSVAVLFFVFRKCYTEIVPREVLKMPCLIASLIAGVGVFAFWIHLDFPAVTMGTLRGFDPTVITDEALRSVLIASRLAGAVLVVPIMEELFWRSFLIRYIINPDFDKVPIGMFTLSSCVITVLLFGVEHNLYLAGMLAGLVYNVLLYRTKSISGCIVAHGVTNLLLGIYVLQTGKWHFW